VAEERVQRRLAAILAADVVGYSRMMGQDEEGTLAALTAHRTELMEPCIAKHRGRVVKTTGDGLLAEFGSVVDAVNCALEVQEGMGDRNSGTPEEQRIAIRIGVNLGDVIFQDDDVYGDGVNIAARLEEICGPNEVYVSANVYDQVEGKVEGRFDDLGAHTIKNIAKPVRVYRAELAGAAKGLATAARVPEIPHQEIHFCTASDGVQIAYATVGKGPPLVKTANWLTHLEYDWASPVYGPWWTELSKGHSLVRYDARGNGLSDWDVDEISFETFVSDLEAVVDAAGLDRFPLFGLSQGCAVSIAYAVRHPERVSRLILYGGFARGRLQRGSSVQQDQADAIQTLIRQGWGSDNPAFRQIFTSLLVPDGNEDQMKWWNELQRLTTSPENALRIREAVDQIEITRLLPQVSQPTLVMHRREDAMQPFEEGRRLAAAIPNSRFVALEGRNHVILSNEKEWPRFHSEIRDFLAGDE
jgi:class 3 adenylate cyclase/pimeloyl-ACP methyl ester carboxylesterase